MKKKQKEHDGEVSITLSSLQIEQVMRLAGQSRNGTVSNLLLAALDNAYQPGNGAEGSATLQRATQEALEEALNDPQLSQSLLRGLAILSSYGPDRPWRAIIDLAEALLLEGSEGQSFPAIVTDLDERGARIQLRDAPVVARVVAPEARFAERSHQVFQGLIA